MMMRKVLTVDDEGDDDVPTWSCTREYNVGSSIRSSTFTDVWTMFLGGGRGVRGCVRACVRECVRRDVSGYVDRMRW